ncbi:ABC transporter ATP-binding protein [Caldanaerobacter subterraneus]|uniref:ABC transporter ATP-binding protein n=1 Tax=Caldanaerobacter subterraneus TaxID=911092 RepID=UPI0034646D8F
MNSYFEIRDLKVSFKTFEGVKRVIDLDSLDINKGETFGLVGESGTGKSVLAMTILRLLPMPPAIIESGQIFFDGEELLSKKEDELRKFRGRRIAMIFQDPMSTLNPVFTVGEQMIRVIVNNEGISRKEAEKKALQMVELVKLPDPKEVLKKYPHELSGGQRQRVIIAIALSCGAEFLIADEPTRNLDVTIQAGILKLLHELQKEFKMTTLFIANNLGLVSAICNRVGIFYKGKIVEVGTVREIIRSHKHPYTETLLNAVPRDGGGNIIVPKLLSNESGPESNNGCSYYDRCPLRDKICKEANPPLRNVTGTHYVACHKAE